MYPWCMQAMDCVLGTDVVVLARLIRLPVHDGDHSNAHIMEMVTMPTSSTSTTASL